MIEVNELRVGNYVLLPNPNHNNRNEICRVSVANRDKNYVSLTRMSLFEDLTPIPKIGKNDRYTFPNNPIGLDKIYPFRLEESILLNSPDAVFNNISIYEGDPAEIDDSFNLGAIRLTTTNKIKWDAEYTDSNNVTNTPLILYLHEIQNLYSDVNGREMDINL